VSISPNSSIKEALTLMRSKKIGSLPVTRDDKLVGILTEHDFMRILELQFK
jgi:CBS domain-containing protein